MDTHTHTGEQVAAQNKWQARDQVSWLENLLLSTTALLNMYIDTSSSLIIQHKICNCPQMFLTLRILAHSHFHFPVLSQGIN